MMSDDEDMDCPLCMEEFDIADRNFRPCPCAYQICRFCWHHIKTNLNGRCPACRRLYSDQIVEFIPVSAEEIQKSKREKKEKERHERDMKDPNRRQLSNVRVVQKNLVYVLGLGSKYANAENDFFKKYGKILKLVVSKRPPTSTGTAASIGIYVTYARKEDAAKAIEQINGAVCDGKSVRASFGTTKYCTYFLRHMPCPNPNCMYLHEAGDDADSYNNENPTVGTKHAHGGVTGYTYPNKRPAASSSSTTTTTSSSAVPPGVKSALTTSTSETVLQPAPPPIKSAWAPLPKVTPPPPPPPAPVSEPEPEPEPLPSPSTKAATASSSTSELSSSPSSSKLGGKQNQNQQPSSKSKAAPSTQKKQPVSLLSASLSQQKQKQVDPQLGTSDGRDQKNIINNKENEKPALPATASWAKGGGQNTQSASLTPDHFGPSLSDALTRPQKPKHESSSLPSASTSRKKDKKKAKMVSLKTFEELTRQSPTGKSPLSSSPLNAALRKQQLGEGGGDGKVDNEAGKEPITKPAWGTLPVKPAAPPVTTDLKQPTTTTSVDSLDKHQEQTVSLGKPETTISSDKETMEIPPTIETKAPVVESVDVGITPMEETIETENEAAPPMEESLQDTQQPALIDEITMESVDVDDKVVSDQSSVAEEQGMGNSLEQGEEKVDGEQQQHDEMEIPLTNDDTTEEYNHDMVDSTANVLDIMFADDVLGSVMTDDMVDSNSDFASDNDEIVKAFDAIGQQQHSSGSPSVSEKIQQQSNTPTMVNNNASPSLFSLAQPMHNQQQQPIPQFLPDMQNFPRRGLQGPPPGFPPPPPGWLPRNFDLFQGQDPALIAARRLQHSQQMLEASGLFGFGGRPPPHPHGHQPPPPPPAPFNFSPDFHFANGGHPPPPPPPPGMFSTPPPHIARPNMMPPHLTPSQQQQQPQQMMPPPPPPPLSNVVSSSSPSLSEQHDLARLRSEFNQMHLTPASPSDSIKALPQSPSHSSSSLHQLASPSFATSSPQPPYMTEQHSLNGEYQLRNDLRAMLPNASISFGPMGNMINREQSPLSRPGSMMIPPPPGFQQDSQMLQRQQQQQQQQQSNMGPDRRQEAQHFFGEFLKNAATHTAEKDHGQEGPVPFHDPAIMSARVAEREKEMESKRSSMSFGQENGFQGMMRPPPFGMSPQQQQQQHLQTLQQQQQQMGPRGIIMPPPGLFDRLPPGMMPPDMKQPDPFMHRPPPPPGLFGHPLHYQQQHPHQQNQHQQPQQPYPPF